MNNFSPDSKHFNEDPPIWKEVELWLKPFGLKRRLIRGEERGWRCRAKLAVRGSGICPLIGLFKEGTHEIVPLLECEAHHPAINQAISRVSEAIIAHGVDPYDEKSLCGDLRYLQLVVQRSSGKVQLTLVINESSWNAPAVKKMEQLCRGLVEESDLWHSLWLNLNKTRGNSILGNEWKCCFGEYFLWEKIGGVECCFSPGSFGQANLSLYERLLGKLSAWVHPGAKILELYAGVGAIGLALAPKAESLVAVEAAPSAHKCFEQMAKKLPADLLAKVEHHIADAKDTLALLDEATVVIVDPPRKGVGKSLLEGLKNRQNLKQLVYVSCGWPAFRQQAALLLESGWRLAEFEGYLFFPGSNHVELLAIFEPEDK